MAFGYEPNPLHLEYGEAVSRENFDGAFRIVGFLPQEFHTLLRAVESAGTPSDQRQWQTTGLRRLSREEYHNHCMRMLSVGDHVGLVEDPQLVKLYKKLSKIYLTSGIVAGLRMAKFRIGESSKTCLAVQLKDAKGKKHAYPAYRVRLIERNADILNEIEALRISWNTLNRESAEEIKHAKGQVYRLIKSAFRGRVITQDDLKWMGEQALHELANQ